LHHHEGGLVILLPWFTQTGVSDESLAEFHTALSPDPLSPIVNTNYGWTLMVARRYGESLAQYQKTLQRDPSFGPAHFKMSHLYASMGRYADAVGETKKSELINAELATPDAKGYCAANQAITGADRNVASAIACAATDRELALRLMEAAYDNHDLVGEFIRSPEFDSLRSDTRYISMMRKMGLDP
jgi:tetratricopeptide (TPR) repeat protein